MLSWPGNSPIWIPLTNISIFKYKICERDITNEHDLFYNKNIRGLHGNSIKLSLTEFPCGIIKIQ